MVILARHLLEGTCESFQIAIHYEGSKHRAVKVPLQNLTQLPDQIHLGYQSSTKDLSFVDDSPSMNTSELLIDPESINIFWWPWKQD